MGNYLESNLLFIFLLLMLIGASAKSAQLGLHGWLANAMEGRLDFIYYFLNNYPIYYLSYLKVTGDSGSPIHVTTKEDGLPELTPYQKEAVIGLLLSDGHISKSSKR